MPLEGWRSAKCNESGKHGLTFNRQDADLESPLAVPCGKCVGCRMDQSRDWGVRCYHESLCHSINSFVTLTYAEPPVVFSKRDLQLFLKRLRNAGYSFRYFGCGEYGSLSGRAHYHALIFGEDFRDGSYPINDSLYGNPIVDFEWGHGLASIGSCAPESCMYTAGYCLKKVNQDSFSVMSRRPAIGRKFLDSHSSDLLATGTCVVGKSQYPVPKKYFEWAYLDPVKDRRNEFVRRMSPEERWQRRVAWRHEEINILSRQSLKQETI